MILGASLLAPSTVKRKVQQVFVVLIPMLCCEQYTYSNAYSATYYEILFCYFIDTLAVESYKISPLPRTLTTKNKPYCTKKVQNSMHETLRNTIVLASAAYICQKILACNHLYLTAGYVCKGRIKNVCLSEDFLSSRAPCLLI